MYISKRCVYIYIYIFITLSSLSIYAHMYESLYPNLYPNSYIPNRLVPSEMEGRRCLNPHEIQDFPTFLQAWPVSPPPPLLPDLGRRRRAIDGQQQRGAWGDPGAAGADVAGAMDVVMGGWKGQYMQGMWYLLSTYLGFALGPLGTTEKKYSALIDLNRLPK